VGKRGASPLSKSLPPLLEKERGIKGVRLINNLDFLFSALLVKLAAFPLVPV